MDLVQWLTACLDEDEEEARRGYLKAEPLPDYDGWDKSTVAGLPPIVAARVLRDIDRDRRILIRCQEAMFATSPMLVHFAKQTLREMALSFEDRPGYAEAIASAE